MNVLATAYTLSTRSLDIYLAGCTPPHCENCHNPESWDFGAGDKYDLYYFKRIKDKLIQFETLIDRIFIMGGEPLDQSPDKLEYLLMEVTTWGKELWLFTRYELSDIPPSLLYWCDYVKTGRYDATKLSDNYVSHGIKLASTNQRVWSRKELYEYLQSTNS